MKMIFSILTKKQDLKQKVSPLIYQDVIQHIMNLELGDSVYFSSRRAIV